PRAAELVKLKFFAGLTLHEAAAALSLPPLRRPAVGVRPGLAGRRPRPRLTRGRQDSSDSWRTSDPNGALEGRRPPRAALTDPEDPLMPVFAAALALGSAADREAYLDRECAGDPALRARVEALLRAHDRAGGFLGPAGGPVRTAAFEPAGEAATADPAAGT